MVKKIIIVLVVLLGVGGAVLVFTSNSDESDTSDSSATNSSTSESTAQASSDESTKYTLSEVAKHATKDDCWTVIDNVVYDITDYIPRHQGGDNILSACGVDGTAFFRGEKPGQEGERQDHSSSAENQLKQFELGPLN